VCDFRTGAPNAVQPLTTEGVFVAKPPAMLCVAFVRSFVIDLWWREGKSVKREWVGVVFMTSANKRNDNSDATLLSPHFHESINNKVLSRGS
jgi:hypothetical protein